MRHIFIAHPIDENYFLMVFFTSKPFIYMPFGERIPNLKCLDVSNGTKVLKFMNKPFLVTTGQLKNYFMIREGGTPIGEILSIDLKGGEGNSGGN